MSYKGLSKEILDCIDKLDDFKKNKSPLYGIELSDLYTLIKGEILACNLSKDEGFAILEEYGVDY